MYALHIRTYSYPSLCESCQNWIWVVLPYSTTWTVKILSRLVSKMYILKEKHWWLGYFKDHGIKNPLYILLEYFNKTFKMDIRVHGYHLNLSFSKFTIVYSCFVKVSSTFEVFFHWKCTYSSSYLQFVQYMHYKESSSIVAKICRVILSLF